VSLQIRRQRTDDAVFYILKADVPTTSTLCSSHNKTAICLHQLGPLPGEAANRLALSPTDRPQE